MTPAAVVTFEEFELLPEGVGKRELIDGEVIELPPPKFRHVVVARRLYDTLRASPHGQRAFQEAGYKIGKGWIQPDVSITWPAQPLRDGYLAGAPQLAVEVLSPRNTAPRIERKLTLYFAEGGSEVWVIDPSNNSMTVYRQERAGVTRTAIAARHDSAFGTIVLADLFA